MNTSSLVLGFRDSNIDDQVFNFSSSGGDQRWFHRAGSINAGPIYIDDKRISSGAVIGLILRAQMYVGRYQGATYSQSFYGKLYKLALLNSAANT